MEIGLEKIPLIADERGAIRIEGTRVTLDCIVEMFEEGASPEQIVAEYDSLKLDQVYAVITYCLRHKEEVKAYLTEQEENAQKSRQAIDSSSKASRLREQLLMRKQESRNDEPS